MVVILQECFRAGLDLLEVVEVEEVRRREDRRQAHVEARGREALLGPGLRHGPGRRAQLPDGPVVGLLPKLFRVERFGCRATESFESFHIRIRSKFCQNSGKFFTILHRIGF